MSASILSALYRISRAYTLHHQAPIKCGFSHDLRIVLFFSISMKTNHFCAFIYLFFNFNTIFLYNLNIFIQKKTYDTIKAKQSNDCHHNFHEMGSISIWVLYCQRSTFWCKTRFSWCWQTVAIGRNHFQFICVTRIMIGELFRRLRLSPFKSTYSNSRVRQTVKKSWTTDRGHFK